LVACVVVPWPLLSAHLAMAALVGGCALRPDHFLAWLTDAPAVRHVGVVSYGMYLVNVPTVAATRLLLGGLSPALPAHTPVVFLVGLGATVAVAPVLHRVVEQPLERARARFRQRP